MPIRERTGPAARLQDWSLRYAGMLNLQDEKVFRRVLDDVPYGVYFVDPSRKILYWNHGAESITGYKSHEVVGRGCYDNLLMHCDEKGEEICKSWCPLAQTMHDGKGRQLRLFLHHKAGHRVPVSVKTFAIRDEHGQIAGAAEIFEQQIAGHHRVAEATKVQGHEREHAEGQGCNTLKAIQGLLDQHLTFGVLCVELERERDFRANHGEEASRALLRVVEDTIRNTLRGSDLVDWYQDMFLIVLPGCTEEGLERTGERIQRVVRGAGIEWWGDWLSAAVVIGATISLAKDTVEMIVARAKDSLSEKAMSTESKITGQS